MILWSFPACFWSEAQKPCPISGLNLVPCLPFQPLVFRPYCPEKTECYRGGEGRGKRRSCPRRAVNRPVFAVAKHSRRSMGGKGYGGRQYGGDKVGEPYRGPRHDGQNRWPCPCEVRQVPRPALTELLAPEIPAFLPYACFSSVHSRTHHVRFLMID